MREQFCDFGAASLLNYGFHILLSGSDFLFWGLFYCCCCLVFPPVFLILRIFLGFPDGSVIKNTPANAGDTKTQV